MTLVESENPHPGAATKSRRKAYFQSGKDRCAAWHYPGTNGACIVMAAGLAVAKEPGTDRTAAGFNDAGFSVLAFDFRRLGESGGTPRQVIRMGDQQADFRAAVKFARALPEVDPARVAIWGFSVSGGHVYAVAAQVPDLAAAVTVSGLADGIAASRNAFRHTTPLSALRINTRATLDMLGGLFGRKPLLIPLAGERGEVASLTTPDSRNGADALNPNNRYPEWQQKVAARSATRPAFYRPGRYAKGIRCPLLVYAPQEDGVAPQQPAVKAAARAPRGEVVEVPGGHYTPVSDGFEHALGVQREFLSRHLLGSQKKALSNGSGG